MRRKFIIPIVIIWFLILSSWAGLVMAEIDMHDGTTISGTIPFCAAWSLSEGNATPFASRVDVTAYNANEILVPGFIKIIDFDCNTKFKITAKKGTWTLPANYSSAGNKKIDGSDSDLLLMVDNVTEGYATVGLAVLTPYDSYTGITTEGSDILGGGAIGSGAGHGVENASCDINAKILMDWASDIVGDYSIDVTLIISERID